MKRLNAENINTPEYFDDQFDGKAVDMENTLRQDSYLAGLAMHPNIKSVIELGCGMSSFLPKAAETYPEVFGLDFSAKAIEQLRKDFPKIIWDVGDATNTLYTGDQFDAVVAGEILEHLEDPQKLVDEMIRICRVGGMMILSTPHLEFNDPEHLWEFTEEDLAHMFSKAGTATIGTLHSEKFPGRKYLIAWTIKEH